MHFPSSRTAIVVAHPGHELRVHGLLCASRPRLFVLTDGSGRSGASRLAFTTALLEAAGGVAGPIYGRLTDAQAYAAILEGEFHRWIALVEELAAALEEDRIDCVAGDAVEGFNPTHDLCRLLINAAVELVRRRTGAAPRNFDFPLDGPPGPCGESLLPRALTLRLDDDALARKMRAARAYTALTGEVDASLRDHREEAFRVECLRPVEYALDLDGLIDDPPFYEIHGERKVAAGHYDRVLRYRQHIVPIAAALRARIAAEG